MSNDDEGFHYVKYHGYTPADFAESGETTPFPGVRVINKHDSDEWEEFENFAGAKDSDWEVNWYSAARLTDGTILYEGQR